MLNFTNALALLRTLRAIAQEMEHVQLSQGLLDLQGQLLQIEVQRLEEQVENRLILDENAQMHATLATARKLERVNEAYFIVNSEMDVRGPYCATCWDERAVLQALVAAEADSGYCPNCKLKVKTGRRVPDQSRAVRAVSG